MGDERISIGNIFRGAFSKRTDCTGCKNCSLIRDNQVECKKKDKTIPLPDYCGDFEKRE